MMRLVSALAATLWLLGCDSTPATGPTAPVPQPIPDQPPSPRYHLLGTVVNGAGAPISDAEITFPSVPFGAPRSTMSDASGRYEVTIQLAGPPQRKSTPARIQKPGYEPAAHWVSVDPNNATSRDLRLHDIYPVAAGASVALTIYPDDPGCGFELYVCRRVRIASSSGGSLTIEAQAPSGTTVTIVRADQEPWPATNRMSIAVTAASVVTVDVSILGGTPGAPHAVTLHSRLE